MEPLVKIAIGLLLAALVAGRIRQIFRQNMLKERTDAICGFADNAKAPVTDASDFGTRLTMLLSTLGLASDTFATRAYFGLGALALGFTFAFFWWEIGLATVAALALGHFVVIRVQRRKRRRQFSDGLPALLDRVRRLVMIGKTLPQAFVESVANADPVIKREIEPFIRRVQYGAPFTDCIDMLARNNNLVELHMLSAYVRTNAKFGGRVAQTLVNLIEQLGNKRRLEREITSATAETRASAVILFGLMALLLVFMSSMNPEYLKFYFSSDQGRLILLCILAWPLIGVLVMKRILTLDF